MKAFTLFLFFHFIISSFAQVGHDTINKVDENGLKQGYWQKKFPNGNLQYKGYFKDDKPIGKLHRYFENGNLRAIMYYKSDDSIIKVKLYYENGEVASEGFYLNMKKDSIWKFYSFYDNTLKLTEHYKDGKKEGFSYGYYPNGKIFEKLQWKNDIKHGVWEQYFEDGALKLRGKYMNGMISGEFEVYYSENSLMAKGLYINDKRHGFWTYFKEDGTVYETVQYVNGELQSEKGMTKRKEEFIKMINENVGKIKEPEPSDFFPGDSGRGNQY